MAEKAKRFIPGSESLEVFGQIVSLLKKWLGAGIVKIEFETDGDVDFILPDDMEALLSTQLPAGLDFKKVRRIIKAEIRNLACSLFRPNPTRWLERILPDDLKIESLSERIVAVEQLLNEDIKKRVWLRKSSKNYVIDEISSNKCTLHKAGFDIPYLATEIVFSKPSTKFFLSVVPEGGPLEPARMDDEKIHLDLAKEDLKELIDKLNSLYASM